MTISLMEFLGNPDLDLNEQDKHIKSFEFDGELKLKTRRKYTWQMQEAGMLTEVESNL